MVIVNQSNDLRHMTIHWLCQCFGELQRQVVRLEAENANLRDRLKRGHQSPLTRPAVKVKGVANGQ